ncbi:hypothetical protein CSOJ01_11465, partial [Colletotrichum sojae]
MSISRSALKSKGSRLRKDPGPRIGTRRLRRSTTHGFRAVLKTLDIG